MVVQGSRRMTCTDGHMGRKSRCPKMGHNFQSWKPVASWGAIFSIGAQAASMMAMRGGRIRIPHARGGLGPFTDSQTACRCRQPGDMCLGGGECVWREHQPAGMRGFAVCFTAVGPGAKRPDASAGGSVARGDAGQRGSSSSQGCAGAAVPGSQGMGARAAPCRPGTAPSRSGAPAGGGGDPDMAAAGPHGGGVSELRSGDGSRLLAGL